MVTVCLYNRSEIGLISSFNKICHTVQKIACTALCKEALKVNQNERNCGNKRRYYRGEVTYIVSPNSK